MPAKKSHSIQAVLTADRVTKNNAVRFVEEGVNPPDQVNLYLREHQVQSLDISVKEGSQITVTIEGRHSA